MAVPIRLTNAAALFLPVLSTPLAKLDTISATTLARLLLRSQQRCKEVSTASQSGSTKSSSPFLQIVRIAYISSMMYNALVQSVY